MEDALYNEILHRHNTVHKYDTSRIMRTSGHQETKMTLKEYLEDKNGISILSSANSDGMVTSAIYSKPHIFDDGTLAFVMRKRLTHENLQTNPYVSYMFIEEEAGYNGIRLFLKKLKEETDNELIEKMKRRHLTPEEDKTKGPKFLVHFRVDKILPLIGDGDTVIDLT